MLARKALATAAAASMLTVGGVFAGGPAHAQALINVEVTDVEVLTQSLNNNEIRILNNVLNNNEVNVGVVAQVVAVICDTNVAAVLAAIEDTGTGQCSVGDSTFTFTQTA